MVRIQPAPGSVTASRAEKKHFIDRKYRQSFDLLFNKKIGKRKAPVGSTVSSGSQKMVLSVFWQHFCLF